MYLTLIRKLHRVTFWNVFSNWRISYCMRKSQHRFLVPFTKWKKSTRNWYLLLFVKVKSSVCNEKNLENPINKHLHDFITFCTRKMKSVPPYSRCRCYLNNDPGASGVKWVSPSLTAEASRVTVGCNVWSTQTKTRVNAVAVLDMDKDIEGETVMFNNFIYFYCFLQLLLVDN